jgi:hypothetical protein
MDASAGSGNASGGAGAGASACCYYSLLGIRKNASATDVRAAYRRLAMKWHPDRCVSDPGEANRRFQRIQEAYSGKAHPLGRPQFALATCMIERNPFFARLLQFCPTRGSEPCTTPGCSIPSTTTTR